MSVLRHGTKEGAKSVYVRETINKAALVIAVIVIVVAS